MFTIARRSAAATAAALVTLSLPAGAQPPPGFADSVLGSWDLTVTDGAVEYPSWLEVRLRTEAELMGRFVGRFGSVRHLPEITFEAPLLRFTAPLQYERGDRPLEFSGTLDAGRLSGTMTDADGRRLQWVGTRAPTLQRAAPPTAGTVVALFNGRDLTGWRGRSGAAAECWQVVDGQLVNTPPCVDLVSENRYDDFELSAEFSVPPGSNSGIYLRGRYEVQIQDTAGQALDSLRMGAVYGFITPQVDAAGAPESWQSLRIRLVGRAITIVLNGTTIIETERIPGITGGALDSREAEPGPVMIQGDHGLIRFRKLELTPLRPRTGQRN